jgi:hypothetical protein
MCIKVSLQYADFDFEGSGLAGLYGSSIFSLEEPPFLLP